LQYRGRAWHISDKTSNKRKTVIILLLAALVAASAIILFLPSGAPTEEAAADAPAYTADEPDTFPTPEEEPGPGLTIFDQRVEAIGIVQQLYMGMDRVPGDHEPLNYYVAEKETALRVTFEEHVDTVFSEGIPHCYISVYNGEEFVTQIAPSGLTSGRNLYFQPKNIAESGDWTEGFYTFELYLGDDEGVIAAALTANFRKAAACYYYLGLVGGAGAAPAMTDDPENGPFSPPEIISGQDEIPGVTPGENIRFDVIVYDEQDGRLLGSEVLWTLDGKEYMTGSALWVWPYELPPGTYTFTCTATNSLGLSSYKDFLLTVTEDESGLPDDLFREDISDALSKGLILPLNRLEIPVSRGQYANLMADFHDAFFSADDRYPVVMTNRNGFGREDYSRSLMVSLGAMELHDGYFEPNRPLSEEEAALIMCRTVAQTIPDFFGAGDSAGIMEALTAYGIFDESGPGAYHADKKLTNKLALIRLSRLYDLVVHNELRIIAEGFEPYTCDDAAIAMRAALMKSAKQGAVINMYFPEDSIVYIGDSETGLTKVSTTGVHVGVLYSGRVHCNVFPGGLPEKEWLESFYVTWGAKPLIEYLPF